MIPPPPTTKPSFTLINYTKKFRSNDDFVVFDPDVAWTVAEQDLHFRHKLSPYLGAKLRGRVMETWLRGEQIFSVGEFIGAPRGIELWNGRETVRA
jgi:allantoinase